jgi:inhibitor of KinA sporulation pathway (predicted exonuclease)
MSAQILIVDLEATCWRGSAPPGETSDIIEIGICVLDVATGERLERESLLVLPERSTVSDFCTELTTLTPEQVAGGISFRAACDLLREKYRSRERVWASYGAYDRNKFVEQCPAYGVEYPFGPKHINVKASFGRVELSRPVGMAGALNRLGIPLEGTHHRGDDDAWNIALILRHLLLERGQSVQDLAQR